MDVDTALLDPTTLRKVSGQLGSNPGGVYEDTRGRCFYVKTLESPAHARNELMAARLYQLCGAPTLTYVKTTLPNQIATVYVELDKKHVARFDESERKQAQRWFGVHAWTANWDAAGFHGDNQAVLGGTVLTLDVGGALLFRGQGDPKGKAFGTSVDELETLRKNPDNPHAMKLFGDMSEEAIRQTSLLVVRTPDEEIRRVVTECGGKPALVDKLLARKADMARCL